MALRHLRRAAASLAAGFAFAATVPAAADSLPEWFGLDGQAAARWSAVADGESRVELRRQGNADARPRHRVLVLYTKRSSAYDIAISKVLSVFDERGVDAGVTALRMGKDKDLGRVALERAQADGYDLIYSMGSGATAFAYGTYSGGAVPVVSICSKDPVLLGQMPDYERGSGGNFAFTSLNVPVSVQQTYLHELRPGLRNIAILFAHQNTSAVSTQLEPMAALARGRGVRVLEVGVVDRSKAAAELGVLVPQAVAAMRETDPELANSIFWITGSTSVFREIAMINRHADVVPVLSAVPEVVTEGDDSAVLSVGISFESNAHLAALYGVEILVGGAAPGSLKVGVVSPPDIAVNFRRARAIGLKVPFSFFESAGFVYDYEGRAVRRRGTTVRVGAPS